MVACFLFVLIASAAANTHAYKGKLGVGGEFGATLLPPRDFHAPEYVRGITGGLRVFFGLTNSIGIEASVHGSKLQDYEPLVIYEATEEEIEPQVVSYPNVERPQQQQHSLGVIYVLDIYRLTPSFALGISRVRSGALSINRGASVLDNHLYSSLAIDYRITKYLWAGFQTRFNLALSDNSDYNGPVSFLMRLSYVWTLERLRNRPKHR